MVVLKEHNRRKTDKGYSLDTEWKKGIEKELTAVQVDVAKTGTVVNSIMREMTAQGTKLDSALSQQNKKTDLVPLAMLIITLVGILAAGVTMVVSPIEDRVTDLKEDNRTLTDEIKEIYYKMGRLDRE